MSKRRQIKSLPGWMPPALCALLTVALAALGWLAYYGDGYKHILLAAGAGIVVALWKGDLKRLGNLPSLLLLSHATFTMLTIIWAVSGKFFLNRYSTVFAASFSFLYAVLRVRGDQKYMRRVTAIIAGISTIYAILGVEAASTSFFDKFAFKLLGGDAAINMGFDGGRLYGVFSNCNIEASFYAIGIIFSIALICGAKNRVQRAFWMFLLVCNAYVLLLGVSIFALVCFAIASIVYLITVGKARGIVLLRMVTGVAFAAAGVLCELSSFGKRFAVVGMEQSYLWTVMLTFAAAAALLDFALDEKLLVMLIVREKAAVGSMIVVLALAAAYLVLGMSLTEPITFSDSLCSIERGVALSPGEQIIQIDADANVLVSVSTRSLEDVMIRNNTQLYMGNAEEANGSAVEVPTDSVVCMVTLSGEPGETIRSAAIGEKQIKLHYRILPAFIANRLVPLSGSHSLLQRLIYVRDGLKIFRHSPIVGLGDGAFESAVSMVQDYEYETNHSHNQYIETLLEGGVIGFTLFVGALVTMGIALWKSRKKMQEGEFAWLYPALCAEFVMSTLQMFWDVSMSVTVFACMIYTLYGLIVSICAEPLVLKKATEQELTTEKKSKASVKTQSDVGIRIACSILPLLFIVSVGLNIHAQKLIREPVETLDEFMSNLSRAAKMDLYEHNDTKLSYVRAQMENDEEGIYYAQANEYAQQLSKVQSNSIPYILTVYYLNTQQYELAIEEAKRGAKWSASDSDMWNNCADALKQMFIDTGAYSPLLEEGNGNLIWGLEEYREMLLQRDANSLKPISLNESSAVFFDKVGELFDCRNDRDAMAAVLAGATGE